MSDAKHTPGPWNIHPAYTDPKINRVDGDGVTDPFDYCSTYIARGEQIIADVQMLKPDRDVGGWPHVESREEMMANTILIAAAPELLEALRDLIAGPGPKRCGHDFDCVCAGDTARAAIAKATGGAA